MKNHENNGVQNKNGLCLSESVLGKDAKIRSHTFVWLPTPEWSFNLERRIETESKEGTINENGSGLCHLCSKQKTL